MLHCQTHAGQALTGRFRLPAHGPQRLYATVALPDGGADAATFAVQASGPATTVALDATRRRATVVADLMGYCGDLTLSVRPVGKGATARIEIAEAWLVSIPVAEADLVTTKPATPSPWLPAQGPAALRDGLHYGPAVAQIPLGGASPKHWTGEWRVKTPDAASSLRALAGLAAECAAAGRARLTMTAEHDKRQWHLMRDLELRARRKDDALHADLPAVIEAAVPAELRGREITLRLEASTAGDLPVVLAIPCLRVCRDYPSGK